MAIGTITRFSEGMGAEQYDAVQAQMDIESKPVEGLIFHSAGELEGRFQVFNVWESRENFDRFETDRLRPAMVAAMGEETGRRAARGRGRRGLGPQLRHSVAAHPARSRTARRRRVRRTRPAAAG